MSDQGEVDVVGPSSRQRLDRFGALFSQRFIVSVGAQALVSAFHFGLTYTLLQVLLQYDYGVFAFAFLVLAQLAGAANNALIGTPLTVYTPTIELESERQAKESMYSLLNIMMFFVVIGMGLIWMYVSRGEIGELFAVTAFVACYAARQYSRCLGYARLRPMVTALGDATYVISGILAVGFVLLNQQPVQVTGILLAMAVANLVAMLVERLRLDRRWWRDYHWASLLEYPEVWRQSRWALLGAVTWLLMSQAHSVLVTHKLGAAAFAPLGAGYALFGPVRMALMTWQNMIKPELAVALHAGEAARVKAQLRQSAMLMGAAVIALGVVLMLAWPLIDRILYQANYADQPMQSIVLMWTGVLFFSALYNSPSATLQAMRDFRVLAFGSLYGAIISLCLVGLILSRLPAQYTLLGVMAAEAFTAVFLLRVVLTRLEQRAQATVA